MSNPNEGAPSQGQPNPSEGNGSLLTTPAAPEWTSSLPDDIKGEGALKQFKDVGALAKSYIHLNKKRNESLQVPGEGATPEDWNGFYSKIGRPDSADKYDLKTPDGVQVNEALMKGFKERAFKAGMAPKQAQEVMDYYHEFNKAALDEYNKKSDEAVAGLRKKWGDDFDKNVAYANAALQEFGGTEIAKQLESSAWGKYPPLVELLSSIGKGLVEKPLHTGDSVNGVAMKDIDSELAKIEANPAFRDRNNPEHHVLIQRRAELYGMKFPEPKES